MVTKFGELIWTPLQFWRADLDTSPNWKLVSTQTKCSWICKLQDLFQIIFGSRKKSETFLKTFLTKWECSPKTFFAPLCVLSSRCEGLFSRQNSSVSRFIKQRVTCYAASAGRAGVCRGYFSCTEGNMFVKKAMVDWPIIPNARHYKPCPKTIYVLWPLALGMACIQEWPMMRAHGIY